MKKITIYVSVIVVAIASILLTFDNEKTNDLLIANLEALAQIEIPEVVIECGSSQGKCWTDDGYEWSFFPIPVRYTKCKFSGYQSSYCIPGVPMS